MNYVELHCHSNYSFYDGASFVDELLNRAKELDYSALALTDHDNLCGAMEFSNHAKNLKIKPIIGVELSMSEGEHLTLLAKNIEGYKNISRLISYNNMSVDLGVSDDVLFKHLNGVVILSGCSKSRVNQLIKSKDTKKTKEFLAMYSEALGKENFFIELQQNLVKGDIGRNKTLISYAKYFGIDIVATNNVHYHVSDRSKLQDILTSIKNGKPLDESHLYLRDNNQFYLKSYNEMKYLFSSYPESLLNTCKISEMCEFDLQRDIEYTFPEYKVPDGYTQQTYLEKICFEAAIRKYGKITSRVENRLQEEFHLIEKHKLAGFLLIYHDIIELARGVMIDLGLTDPEIPLEERPPGRGRGSSVAMLVGYLIGLSHIDPLTYNLSLNRFLPNEMDIVPDIDLDFPRNIREELIKRVHLKWGSSHAVLTGMFSTYKEKGAIRDIGKSLGLPKVELEKLVQFSNTGLKKTLSEEIFNETGLNINKKNHLWNELVDIVSQIKGFPKYLGQHASGMIISTSPIDDMVPIQPANISGRYICQWDKKSIEQARFIKIDFLALGTLSQMQEILTLVEKKTGNYIDLARIDFNDQAVYRSMHSGDTIGIFQIESAAQIQTIKRIKPINLIDMAYEVACVRPGVGINDGVSQFIRRRNGEHWEYDHILEEKALNSTLGVILFQDQVNKLAMEIGNLSEMEADELRRAFGWKRSNDIIESYKTLFIKGATSKGLSRDIAIKIFKKFNGQYMFPESHAFAFGVTAYHMAWLKYYFPLEFFVSIFNQQPMGFYNLETLKEDAKRHNVVVKNPDINISNVTCSIVGKEMLLGLNIIKNLGYKTSEIIINERYNKGFYKNINNLISRTGINYTQTKNLIYSGALDSLGFSRRDLIWQLGLFESKPDNQRLMDLDFQDINPVLSDKNTWKEMLNEYSSLGLYPNGHVMEHVRKQLGDKVIPSNKIERFSAGSFIFTAGLIIRRQRPLSKAIFLTMEDEFGHIPLMVWPDIYEKNKMVLSQGLIGVSGIISKREGTFNVIVQGVWPINNFSHFTQSKDWQ